MDEQELAFHKSVIWRWIGSGAGENDIFDAFTKINSLDDWHREFSQLAYKYENAADATEDGVLKASGYLRAAGYYHMAGIVMTEDSERKIKTYWASSGAYMKGAEYYWRPVERVEYPYKDKTLTGFIQKAPGVKKAPCIVIMNGADGAAEVEDHIISNYFLQKGFSTFRIYVPGQYVARFSGLPMTPDFEKPVTATLDYLQTRSDIDLDRIALFGSSVGGFMAPRAAAFEKRVKACISLGGFYGLDEFDYPPGVVAHLLNDMKITTEEWPEVRKEYNLDGIIDKITCPLLVVNGLPDCLQPPNQTQKIYDNAHCPKDLKLYEGAEHCAWFKNRDVLVDIANWAWTKLHAR